MHDIRLPRALALLLVAVATAACGDDPFAQRWVSDPEVALVYSLTRPELGLPSGFDFPNRAPVVLESPSVGDDFDLVLEHDASGGLVLLPPGALGVESEARLIELPGLGFNDIDEAPAEADPRYSDDEPVPLREGSLYIVRTREVIAAFGQRCNFYAKFVPVEIDVDAGVFSFVFDTNPVCNSRNMRPDEGA